MPPNQVSFQVNFICDCTYNIIRCVAKVKFCVTKRWVRWCNVIQFAENAPAKIEQGWVNRPRNKFGVTVCVVLHRSASLRCGGSCVRDDGLRYGCQLRQWCLFALCCIEVPVCVRDASLRCGTGLRCVAQLQRGASKWQLRQWCRFALCCQLRRGASKWRLRRGCLLSLPARLSQQPQFNPCVIDFTCCKEP